MITLHHLENSQSFRIVWLLEELEMPYELKIYKRTAEKLAPPEYKAISPLGTSPTITVDDGNLALSESNAIIEYVLDEAESSDRSAVAKNLRPGAGSKERVPYLFWFHTSAASFQSLMSMDTIFQVLPKRSHWPINAILRAVASKVNSSFIRPRLDAIFKLAEEQLHKHQFLAGDHLTAADVTIIYSFDAAVTQMPDLKAQYPACSAWLERMMQRPALKKALEKVNQDSISLKDF
ncbi:hypothetical protein ACA910_000037 [Epithemia clementina (nom. ined.)]